MTTYSHHDFPKKVRSICSEMCILNDPASSKKVEYILMIWNRGCREGRVEEGTRSFHEQSMEGSPHFSFNFCLSS